MNISLNSPTVFSTRFPVRGFPRGIFPVKKQHLQGPQVLFLCKLIGVTRQCRGWSGTS